VLLSNKENCETNERALARGTMWKTNGKEGERSLGMETTKGEDGGVVEMHVLEKCDQQ